MRLLMGSACALGLVVAAAADENDDALKKFNGTYNVISATDGGKPTQKKLENGTFVFKDGKITVQEGGKTVEVYKVTMRPDEKNPAQPKETWGQIDLTPEEKDRPPLYGIYEYLEADNGNAFNMWLSKDKAKRPKDTKGGDNVTIIRLLMKREKK